MSNISNRRDLRCPACHGSLRAEKTTLTCRKCERNYPVLHGIPFFSKTPAKPDISLSQKRWNALYKEDDITTHSPIQDKTVASYIRFLSSYEPLMKDGMLDLGCGIAWTGLELARKRIPVSGIDISPEAVLKSKALFEKARVKGTFLQGDLTALPFADSQFHFIYSCMSLEYVRDTQKAIDESFRVLIKGGTMIAIVPVISVTTLTYHQSRGDIVGLPVIRPIMEWMHLKLFKGKYMRYGYEQSFTVGTLRSLFQKSGFTVKKIDYFPMHYPLEFLPGPLRKFGRRLLHWRPFWPLVYVEARK